MATEIVWNDLTPEESRTLADLEHRGIPVFPAPIEILHGEQLQTLGITWSQVRSWKIGSEEVKVHLTPAPKEVYDMLLRDLRKRHRNGYRAVRCMVEGRSGRLIRCPDTFKCSVCPYGKKPEERDANIISWEQCAEDGYEPAAADDVIETVMNLCEYEQIRERLHEADPDLVRMVEMKAAGYSVKQIADELHKLPITVYKSFERIARIGNSCREEDQ